VHKQIEKQACLSEKQIERRRRRRRRRSRRRIQQTEYQSLLREEDNAPSRSTGAKEPAARLPAHAKVGSRAPWLPTLACSLEDSSFPYLQNSVSQHRFSDIHRCMDIHRYIDIHR
jgi:hypothetical protein